MHRQSSTIARLLAKKQRTYFRKYLAEGGHRKFLGHFKSHWLKEVVRNSWDILQAISGHKESHGSHGNFYEREQEQCHSISAEVLHGGLRISQWHKLCWSCAGVALAGTTCQLSLSRIFPGFLYYEIQSHHHLRRWAAFCSFQTSFLSTVVQPVWFSLWSFAVIPSVSTCNWVDIQAGPDSRMQPSFKLKKMAQVRRLGKGSKMLIGNLICCDIPAIQQ